MTIPEFLERLKQTEGPWVLVDGYCIRNGKDCPLTSLSAKCEDAEAWEIAADELGLDFTDAMNIVDAADDGAGLESDAVLRAQLLDATVNRS